MALLVGVVKCIRKNVLDVSVRLITAQNVKYTRLAEVGRLETPKVQGKYETGQLFLHRVFGYRGVILFPWLARVYDRDVPNKRERTQEESNNFNHVGKEVKGRTHTYYQVLIDSRDCPYIASATNAGNPRTTVMSPCRQLSTQELLGLRMLRCRWEGIHEFKPIKIIQIGSVGPEIGAGEKKVHITPVTFNSGTTWTTAVVERAQTEAVTFLGNQESSRSLYAIPGLDYVAHEDILPYTTTEKQALHHELFDKFLVHCTDREPPFSPQETLKAWQEKNHPWLELSDVHKETTENVRVTVIPFYMGCRESQTASVYWWRYCIRLENLGDLTVQLRERHWRIFSLSGTLETVRGRGVVGQEPVLSKQLPAFQYSSHVSLQAPSGHMWGTFRMEREDGYMFDCRIPPFSLESKQEDTASPNGVA